MTLSFNLKQNGEHSEEFTRWNESLEGTDVHSAAVLDCPAVHWKDDLGSAAGGGAWTLKMRRVHTFLSYL